LLAAPREGKTEDPSSLGVRVASPHLNLSRITKGKSTSKKKHEKKMQAATHAETQEAKEKKKSR
jgi:hypothetical protein